MDSKTRFYHAMEGKPIDRLPMWYGAEPDLTHNIMKLLGVETEEQMMQEIHADFRTIRPKYIGPKLARYEDGTFDSIWGIRRGGGFWGTALNHPLEQIEDVRELDKFEWPSPDLFDVEFTPEEIALSKDYAIIGGEWAPFFIEAYELVGMEKLLMDMYINPELAMGLIERCLDFHLEINERLFPKYAQYIDMYWFANDYGITRGLLMDPDMWRKYLKPLQKKLADQGHKYGMKVAMHSCGDITSIIPDLIDIGIEIVNPIQVNCPGMDPQKLKREFGKDIVFFGGIDYNELLSNGTPSEVKQGVKDMIDILGYDGKMIVAPTHDLLMGEVPAENMVMLYKTAYEYSPKFFE
ncbi:uroporphyrinogen decarboxylase family protein [Christensenella tenuis]|jgi:uroporphyrinogen decarboxylase|uniref:Uroporphyrinogen decarboxylase (URO-D) domain-containing protein n=1 Tax=Christensenella tenuis TaxID=2763033 RepID=A0ABR7ECW2_9FIRM|nr:uroporphyrinogen decarboxylase family protein [Christensenella tenuis]MBC5647622.1 hypothetical protein [Christensenella tenuis]